LLSEIPTHTHSVAASSGAANETSPASNFFANGNETTYSNATKVPVAPMAPTGSAGGSQPHDNLSPYLVLNFCIALQGIFPSQN
jgi:microcystin-dependent protein